MLNAFFSSLFTCSTVLQTHGTTDCVCSSWHGNWSHSQPFTCPMFLRLKKKIVCCVMLSDTALLTETVSNCTLPSCTVHHCSLAARERPVAIAKLSACTQETELTDSQLAYVSKTSRDACLRVERSEEVVGSCIAITIHCLD